MSEKKDVRKQIKINTEAHLTLTKLKSKLEVKNFSETIQESYTRIYHLERVFKEVQSMNRLYSDIIKKQVNDLPLNHEETELTKYWIFKKNEIEN